MNPRLMALINRAKTSLVNALALDAMACHFLTDMFAPGHLRTPRVALHNHCQETTGALLSKCSHDQDNKKGMKVMNEMGDKWFAMGDSMYFDRANRKNRVMTQRAVVASIREVLDAFVSGRAGPVPSVIAQAAPRVKDNTLNGAIDVFKNKVKSISSMFSWDKYLQGEHYDGRSIEYKALQIAPSPKLSEPLNRIPAMFKMIGNKLNARRRRQGASPHEDNSDKFKRYVYMPVRFCEAELIKQDCDVV